MDRAGSRLRCRTSVSASSLTLAALLAAVSLAGAPGAAEAAAPPPAPVVGAIGDSCPEGVGGYGEWNVLSSEWLSFTGGTWDFVKGFETPLAGERLGKVCLCLHGGSSWEPTKTYNFDIVAYAANPDGTPGAELMVRPAQVVLDYHQRQFYGFDLGDGGFDAKQPIVLGVRSFTDGVDPGGRTTMGVCQYPRPNGASATFYRQSRYLDNAWQEYSRAAEGDRPMVGIRATYVDAAEPPTPPGGGPRTCVESSRVACMNRGRFQIEATLGEQSTKLVKLTPNAVSVSTTNGEPELLVKVQNQCSTTGSFKVQASGSPEHAVSLKVTDLATGRERVYNRKAGAAFVAVRDAKTFSCGN
jgi:hypothetical protein